MDRYLFNFKQAEADDGTGKGGAGGSDDTKGGDPNDKGSAQVEVLGRAVTLLAQGFDELKAGNEELRKLIASNQKPSDDGAAKPQEVSPETMFEGVDLSTLDNAGLAKLVVTAAGKMVEAKLADIGKLVDGKVAPLADSLSARDVREQISTTSKDNPDFFEWAPEIKDRLAKNPSLSVREAYILVKNENPQKLEEITKKYTKKPEAKPGFGLTPTSGGSSEGRGKMNPRDAANAAFDEVMSSLGIVHKDTNLI